MPIIWMGFSTASTPEVHEYRTDPLGLREYVHGVVDRAGATLEELYFEVGAERACALVTDLDDYISAKAVTRILGADQVTKLVNPNQAAEALERETGFRPPPSA